MSCVSVMWVWLVIKLVDWYYYYVESIPLHPLYRSICVHCTQYVHPFYPLFVFCPLDLIIYASMVPAYRLMSTVSVHPLFLYCVHCLVSVQLFVSSTCGCGLLSEGVCHLYGRKKKKVVCLFFACSAFRQLLSCFYFSFWLAHFRIMFLRISP